MSKQISISKIEVLTYEIDELNKIKRMLQANNNRDIDAEEREYVVDSLVSVINLIYYKNTQLQSLYNRLEGELND